MVSAIAIQTRASDDREDNLERALRLIDAAGERYRQIDIICLPELFYFDIGPEKIHEGTSTTPQTQA